MADLTDKQRIGRLEFFVFALFVINLAFTIAVHFTNLGIK